MLTNREYHELYRLIEIYADAWEAYVKAVRDDAVPSQRQRRVTATLGMAVTTAKDNLLKYLKEIA
jgi:hypothetical protein